MFDKYVGSQTLPPNHDAPGRGYQDQALEAAREETFMEMLLNRLQTIGAIQSQAISAQVAQWDRLHGPQPVCDSCGDEEKPYGLISEVVAQLNRLQSQASDLRFNAERANNRI